MTNAEYVYYIYAQHNYKLKLKIFYSYKRKSSVVIHEKIVKFISHANERCIKHIMTIDSENCYTN